MTDLALRLVSSLGLTLLAPVLMRQGKRVRATTPRLPEAPGPHTGEVGGSGTPVRLLVVGESTAAGVGAANHQEGLTGQVAMHLAAQTGRPVRWRVIGRNGATASALRERLASDNAGLEADVVVIALGVNDTLRLTPPARWTRSLRQLVDLLRGACGPVPVLLASVPPVGRFPGLPQPLRGVLGMRATVLDRAAARLAGRMDNVRHVPLPLPSGADDLFCGDRIHPSPAGYAQIGAALGHAAASVITNG
jgi:lysophospholipase L1-like esterase